MVGYNRPIDDDERAFGIWFHYGIGIIVWLVFEDGQPDYAAYLHILIHPAIRTRVPARGLFAQLEDWCLEQGIEELRAEPEDAQVQDYLERLGWFQPDGEPYYCWELGLE